MTEFAIKALAKCGPVLREAGAYLLIALGVIIMEPVSYVLGMFAVCVGLAWFRENMRAQVREDARRLALEAAAMALGSCAITLNINSERTVRGLQSWDSRSARDMAFDAMAAFDRDQETVN